MKKYYAQSLLHVWQFNNEDPLTEKLTTTYEISAVRGHTVDNNGGWPPKYISTHQGEHAEFTVYDQSKRDHNDNIIAPCIQLHNTNLHQNFPWTAILEFAIDPLTFGSDGKNGWQREETMLLSHWVIHPTQKNHPDFDLFKLALRHRNGRTFLTLDIKQQNTEIMRLELEIPEDLQTTIHPQLQAIHGKYPIMRALMSLGESNAILALDAPNMQEMNLANNDPNTNPAEELPRYYQMIERNIGTYPTITKGRTTIMPGAFNVEITALTVWSKQILTFPAKRQNRPHGSALYIPESWPFES